MARILIAEDEEALRALTARALTDSGHDVVTAVDGADALDILTRENGRFELLHLLWEDQHLQPMSCFQVLKMVRL
jgi:DNA-binding response OmpR family regulator